MSKETVVSANPQIDRANLGHIAFILAFFMATASTSPLFATSIVLALWGFSLVISAAMQNEKKE